MIKALFIFGTRPEAIKMAPVMNLMKAGSSRIKPIVCVTAQHREMLDQVLGVFQIEPDYDLDIMRSNQNLFDITTIGLKKIEDIFKKVKPHIVLVQGDTTTTFIASLAAYYLNINIAHIEAGLRTKDKYNPFPEEINRKLTDCLADFYFVHTERAKKNLLREGVSSSKIFYTGNTVVDALKMIIRKQRNKTIQQRLESKFMKEFGITVGNQKIVLVTGHRRESFGRDFENICYGLKKIAASSHDIKIIYPVHLNPNVQRPVRRILDRIKNIHLITPLDYFSFVWLMNKAYLILTDSGGIQEEAPSLGKPVLVMRNKTERIEGVKAGTAKLVGTDSDTIYRETIRLLENKRSYAKMAKADNPYGDGTAAARIIKVLEKQLLVV
jgi:UDP-N-acetylglucosamine 2-epimerase (non-hydrolysing)